MVSTFYYSRRRYSILPESARGVALDATRKPGANVVVVEIGIRSTWQESMSGKMDSSKAGDSARMRRASNWRYAETLDLPCWNDFFDLVYNNAINKLV